MTTITRTVETVITLTNDKPAEYDLLEIAIKLLCKTFGLKAELTRRGYDYDLKITISEER